MSATSLLGLAMLVAFVVGLAILLTRMFGWRDAAFVLTGAACGATWIIVGLTLLKGSP